MRQPALARTPPPPQQAAAADLASSTSSLPPRQPAAALPAELEALLGPLAQARSVLGLLVLARAGSTAAAAAAAAAAAHAPPPTGSGSVHANASDGHASTTQDQSSLSPPPPIDGPTIIQALGAPFEGDQGQSYALRVAGMVDAVEQGCVGSDGSGVRPSDCSSSEKPSRTHGKWLTRKSCSLPLDQPGPAQVPPYPDDPARAHHHPRCVPHLGRSMPFAAPEYLPRT
jgi:hypothetical protein